LFVVERVSFLSDQELSELVRLGKGLLNNPSEFVDKGLWRSPEWFSSVLSPRDNWKCAFLPYFPSQLLTVKAFIGSDIYPFRNRG
jgi:hypothetical protein